MTLSETVAEALTSVDTDGVDQAAARLAETYAEQIDNGGDLSKLGPGLLAALESLGMTPRARRNAMKGASGVRSPLDELRQRRADRSA